MPAIEMLEEIEKSLKAGCRTYALMQVQDAIKYLLSLEDQKFSGANARI